MSDNINDQVNSQNNVQSMVQNNVQSNGQGYKSQSFGKFLTTSKYFLSTGKNDLPSPSHQLFVIKAVLRPSALMHWIAVSTSGYGSIIAL